MTQIQPIQDDCFDDPAKPLGSFSQFVNGAWTGTTSIPPQCSRWGTILMLAENSPDSRRQLLEAAAAQTDAPNGSSAQLVGNFFFSGMDQAKIAAAGAEPVAPLYKLVDSVSSRGNRAEVLARLHRSGVDALFGFGSAPDLDDAKSMIAHAGQGGLGLPDRDYYLKRDKKSISLRGQYLEHIARLLFLLGQSKGCAKRDANAVLRIETALARVSMTRVKMRDTEDVRNKMTVDQFQNLFSGFDVKRYFASLGAPAFTLLNVLQPKYFTGLARLLSHIKSWELKAYLRWQLIRGAAPYLCKAYEDEHFAFYGQALRGLMEPKPRWERMISMVGGALEAALAEVYVAKYLPRESEACLIQLFLNVNNSLREAKRCADFMAAATKYFPLLESKVHMQQLIAVVQNAVRETSSVAERMSSVTRASELVKMQAFNTMIGYPDGWHGYKGLIINRHSFYDNQLRATEYACKLNLAKIGSSCS